jgi:dihydroorotate dehydrogenase
MYQLIRAFLFLFDEEAIQRRVATFGHWLGRSPFLDWVKAAYKKDYPSLHTTVAGLNFSSALGVAAGFDKPAQLLPILSALGFSAVEVGTVTPEPQPGNPAPRLFRLPKDQALINRMGFNSEGVASLVKKLRSKPDGLILGVNIGKNKITPNELAAQDYQKAFGAVANYADYVTINISSPNTPGLRELQDKNSLRVILNGVQALNRQREHPTPVFLKIAPDLTDGQLDGIVEIVRESGIAGIIATNTTIVRGGLKTSAEEIKKIGNGGLSGPALKTRATQIIAYLYRKSSGTIPIIGVGGIASADDAYEKIRAGASLVQMYTAIVYEGPGVAKKINAGLTRLLERDGFKSIAEAVGTKV